MRYTVSITQTNTWELEVEANSLDEAQKVFDNEYELVEDFGEAETSKLDYTIV
jgi:hypothetical protein